MWTLDESLKLIRTIQPEMKNYEYHITLGGGILNNGISNKDLDLFFLKLNNHTGQGWGLFQYLSKIMGPLIGIRDSPDYHEGDMWHYTYMYKGRYDGKRVDLFIQ
jgi:hypothetical protein